MQFPDHRGKDIWEVYINGNDEPRTVSSKTEGGMTGFRLPQYDSAVFYNGWLAGVIGPCCGAMITGGDGGEGEDNLIASIRAAKVAA